MPSQQCCQGDFSCPMLPDGLFWKCIPAPPLATPFAAAAACFCFPPLTAAAFSHRDCTNCAVQLTILPPVEELQTDPETRAKWIDYSAYDAKATWQLAQALKKALFVCHNLSSALLCTCSAVPDHTCCLCPSTLMLLLGCVTGRNMLAAALPCPALPSLPCPALLCIRLDMQSSSRRVPPQSGLEDNSTRHAQGTSQHMLDIAGHAADSICTHLLSSRRACWYHALC